MKVTLYRQPYGHTVDLDITNVLPEDAAFFEKNNIRISMEEVGGMFAVYADDGTKTEDGEPDELIELSQGRTCEETLHALRKQCEQRTTARETSDD